VAELGFLQGIADAARGAGLTGPLLLTGGTEQGVFLLDADPEQVAAIGPRVAEALEGRGGGRGRRFQGKAQRLQAASAQLLR
jgi:misacylated tRNA(Ala) deacylase